MDNHIVQSAFVIVQLPLLKRTLKNNLPDGVIFHTKETIQYVSHTDTFDTGR